MTISHSGLLFGPPCRVGLLQQSNMQTVDLFETFAIST